MLDKALETIKAQSAEIEARAREQKISDAENAALKEIVANQQKLIEILLNRSKTKVKVCLIC